MPNSEGTLSMQTLWRVLKTPKVLSIFSPTVKVVSESGIDAIDPPGLGNFVLVTVTDAAVAATIGLTNVLLLPEGTVAEIIDLEVAKESVRAKSFEQGEQLTTQLSDILDVAATVLDLATESFDSIDRLLLIIDQIGQQSRRQTDKQQTTDPRHGTSG